MAETAETGEPRIQIDRVEMTQHWLGLTPYTLIELDASTKDPGEPAVRIEVGGGAEEEPMALLIFAITGTPVERNIVAEMLRNLADDATLDRATVAAMVDQFNPDWKPFVFREV